MTTLTQIPKSVHIQQLPYQGPKGKKPQPHRKFAIFVKEMGVMAKVGSSYATLETACRKAAQVSLTHPEACVMDQSLTSGKRMVKIFRRGVDFLAH